MKKFYSVCLFLFAFSFLIGQNSAQDYFIMRKAEIDSVLLRNYRQVDQYFQNAYSKYPTIPRGILEAVAYVHSRFVHIRPNMAEDFPENMPLSYGIMGLVQDGKGIFRENLPYVSRLSGISDKQLMNSAQDAIMAYASSYASLQQSMNIGSMDFIDQIPILQELSELPLGESYWFSRASELYEICSFINNVSYRRAFGIGIPTVSMEDIFKDKLSLLQSPQLYWDDESSRDINDDGGEDGSLKSGSSRGSDYASARWVAAGTCNYSARNGTAISSVTIHYTQGTYAGAIAWFQNCTYNGVGAQVSAHYVIRSSDGQVTQMVRETNKAWHVGSANSYTVGIEHEAYGDIISYFTPEMYQASADLTRDICQRNHISTHRVFYRDTLDDGSVLNAGLHSLGGVNACTKIRGHQHYPNQSHTDPGPYWDWNYYYKLINNSPIITTYTTATGIFTDSGGENGNYGDDERKLYLIKVEDADYITLNFSEFSLEANYDFMWIYDGNTVFSPLLGRWNTQSPGTVRSSGNALLVEFRSDCATNASGWVANWNAFVETYSEDPIIGATEGQEDSIGGMIIPTRPITAINCDETEWVTDDITVSFDDISTIPIKYRFYQIMGNDGVRWTANANKGFLVDNFDDLSQDIWTINSGTWSENQNSLQQSGSASSLIVTSLNDQSKSAMLYDFYATYIPIANQSTAKFGLCFHSSNLLQNRSISTYKLVISPKENSIKLYKSNRGVETELCAFSRIGTNANVAYFYRILHDQEQGIIYCYRDGVLIGQYKDLNPLSGAGHYLGFYTKSTGAIFDNVRAYSSRGDQVVVTVGSSLNDVAQWQARNGVAKTKIKSIIFDTLMQASAMTEKTLKIDYSAPLLFGQVSDGLGNDLDVTYSNFLAAHWPRAIDPNSGIYCYYYGLQSGNEPFGLIRDRAVYDTSFLQSFALQENKSYIAKVVAKNAAGLMSSPIFSDGFIYRPSMPVFHSKQLSQFDSAKVVIFPNPVENLLNVNVSFPENYGQMESMDMNVVVKVRIYNTLAQLVYENNYDNLNFQINLSSLIPGTYILYLMDESQSVWLREKIVKCE